MGFVLAIALGLAPTAAQAAVAKASLTDIENDVMCVSCHEPLAVAQSPQAVAERGFISGLIAQGQTKAQIERALVAQYGPAVLGRPPAHGFNLTVYILPPALLLAGIALLAITLPRWRRRGAARATAATTPTSLSASEAKRLDEDLAHFDA
ncbi:MAG: cytochrome c-type biogenesis protein CcmH [Solirubrobacterales bacterium]|nr:cytochrome c-type biogenesis protein CcmH [Solirubrobacterales bacterium]